MFDGFSIGSNDLTQLTLGVDRDSELVAHIFDERNPAVKTMIAQVISVCRPRAERSASAARRPAIILISPSSWSSKGIDSISLNPDTVLKTTLAILEKERSLS